MVLEPISLTWLFKYAIPLGIAYSLSVTTSKVALVCISIDIRRDTIRRLSKRLLLTVLILQASEEIVVSILACHPTQGRVLFEVHGVCKCAQQRPMWFTGVWHLLISQIALPWRYGFEEPNELPDEYES